MACSVMGLGTDVTSIKRIDAALRRFGDRFVKRVFTASEEEKCSLALNPARCYAKRFAAKEACLKALESGLSQGIRWKDIEVGNLPSGCPTLTLSGRAAEVLAALLPPKSRANIYISLTDECDIAQAIVILGYISLK